MLLNMLALGTSAPPPAIMLTYLMIIVAALSVEKRLISGHVVLIICAVPSSFSNIFGGDYSAAPVSLFNMAVLSLLCVTLMCVLTGRLKLRRSLRVCALLVLGGAVVFSGVRTSLVSPSLPAALKDLATVVMLVSLWTVAVLVKVNSMERAVVEKYVGAYLSAVVATAIFVLIQALGYLYGGASIGILRGSLEQGRIGFQALFADMSVLSVYLASGAAIVVGCLAGARASAGRALFLSFVLLAVLMATFLTSARAGLVAFLLSVIVVFFHPFLRSSERIWIASRGAVLGVVVILIAYIYVTSLGFRRLPWSASGLVDVHRLNLGLGLSDFLWNNLTAASLLFGTAFGSLNHTIVTSLPFTPHNIVMEGFLNGGLIMVAYLMAIVGMTLYAARRELVITLPILTILAGAMVSPSMMESRYLGVMILIALVYCVRKRRTGTGERP
jgi:hypothetical protein